MQGFGFSTINKHSPHAFVFLYCLANFFQNFGPNVTTFVIPGEAFPTRYRSTAHGISAASGKLGAIVAQVGFAQLINIGGTNQVGSPMAFIYRAVRCNSRSSCMVVYRPHLGDLRTLHVNGYLLDATDSRNQTAVARGYLE